MSRGSIGWRPCRSTATKPASAASPTAPAASAAAFTPRSPASISAHVTPASPTAVSTAPATSMPGTEAGSRVSGTWRSATATTAAASGTLIRKMRRHDPTPTSHPPTNGPMAAATPGQPRPGTDRPRTVAGRERRLKDGEAARREQRPADSLERPGGHKPPGGRSQGAQQRRGREPDHAREEHAPAAEPITQRTADQDQRRQRQRVGVQDPLQARYARAQLGAERGQRDVHDGGVEKRDARSQHGGKQDPPRLRRPPSDRLVLRTCCAHDPFYSHRTTLADTAVYRHCRGEMSGPRTRRPAGRGMTGGGACLRIRRCCA